MPPKISSTSPVAVTMMSASSSAAGLELNAIFREGLDLIRLYAGTALANGDEQIGVGNKAQTLFPWVVL